MTQITPPIGFNLFVLWGMTNYEITYIARAAAPVFGFMCIAIAIIVLLPEIATFLPAKMSERLF